MCFVLLVTIDMEDHQGPQFKVEKLIALYFSVGI